MALLLRRSPGIICREIRGETILYDPRDESIHVLNPTAAAIWQLCDGERNSEAIALGLSCRFASTECVDLRTDVVETLRTFRALGLLENGNAEAIHRGSMEEQ